MTIRTGIVSFPVALGVDESLSSSLSRQYNPPVRRSSSRIQTHQHTGCRTLVYSQQRERTGVPLPYVDHSGHLALVYRSRKRTEAPHSIGAARVIPVVRSTGRCFRTARPASGTQQMQVRFCHQTRGDARVSTPCLAEHGVSVQCSTTRTPTAHLCIMCSNAMKSHERSGPGVVRRFAGHKGRPESQCSTRGNRDRPGDTAPASMRSSLPCPLKIARKTQRASLPGLCT